MKKLLALVLSMLLVASCFALAAVAADETTAEETADPTYTNTLIVFDDFAKELKVIGNQTGINKAFYNSEWEGARLKITEVGDPYVYINWSSFIKKGVGLEPVDSQEYPIIVFKLKVEGYVDDIELFYAAGEINTITAGYSTTTDYPCDCSGEVEYIIYDLSDDDIEGNYNTFRFDPMGADEDTCIYLYEMALFATIEEAEAYAQIVETEAPETSEETEEETAAAATTEEETTKPASARPEKEEKKNCNSVIGVGAILAIASLGVVCIKKKD